jgi:ubiquinone biosynthesis protein UbiJ
MPLPSAICDPAEFIINIDLSKTLREDELDTRRLKRLAEQVIKFSLRSTHSHCVMKQAAE